VPVHFKSYDGNQTDDGIHLETWNRLRTLLQHGSLLPSFPKTVAKWRQFTEVALASDVGWEEFLRKRADRDKEVFDVIECAVRPYRLREQFILYWNRPSQKKRDARSRGADRADDRAAGEPISGACGDPRRML
jgi:hypothetical protein